MNVNASSAKLNKQEGWVSLVTFRLEQQVYALPIEPIRQIIEMITVTAVPQVKKSIEGVINFHGLPVPVINLRRQLSLPPIALQLHTPIILVTLSNRLVGLIVDEVLEVLNLPQSQVIHPEMILPNGVGEASALHGLIQMEGKTVLCLDLDHLFAYPLQSDLAAIPDILARNLEAKIEKKDAPSKRRRRETLVDQVKSKLGPVEA